LSFGGNSKSTPKVSSSQATQVTTPELDAANTKCEQLHAKLDQAKKQLEAAKANLKAAEAELKAAHADKDALSLRTQAIQLASKAAVDPIVTTAPATSSFSTAGADAPTVHQIDSNGMNTTPLPAASTSSPPTLQDLAPANVP
jgi:multidrug resistance efflux pump